MAKQKRRRGRPKYSTSGEPNNLNYWRFVIKSDDSKEFISRGSAKQKAELKSVLQYIEKNEPKLFEKINGKQLLKELKG